MKEIHIVLASDDSYARYAGAVIVSVLKHAKEEDRPVFHILDSGISDFQKKRLLPLGDVRFHPVGQNAFFEQIALADYLSQATLLRLSVPELLPELSRIIYLDCDVIAMDSLSELWDFPLGDAPLAGTPDFNSRLKRHSTDLKIEDSVYVNAGVLLMNLDVMRQNNSNRKFKEAAETFRDKITMADQDIINIAFAGNMKRLPLRWNLSGGFFKREAIPEEFRADLENAMNNPGIIHYTSARKPWTLRTPRHPFWEEYFFAVKDSVYSSEFLHFLKKYILPRGKFCNFKNKGLS